MDKGQGGHEFFAETGWRFLEEYIFGDNTKILVFLVFFLLLLCVWLKMLVSSCFAVSGDGELPE